MPRHTSLYLLARILSLAVLALGASFSLRVRALPWVLLRIPKALAESVAAYVAAAGVLGGLLSLLTRAPLVALAGWSGAALAFRYVRRTTAPHAGFEQAFGPDWEARLPPALAARVLPHRFTWYLPSAPEPQWQRNVPYWWIPGRDRPLLCDLWQPPVATTASGVAFVYFHGAVWHYLGKDFGTRPLFRHLAAQGHVVMDVANRLCPEVDFVDMLGDVKRAVAWIKANASQYGVDPKRIVLAGGSSGGHLALLAAYTPGLSALTPAELHDVDLSVCGVVAYYPNSDLRALYAFNVPGTERAGSPRATGTGRLPLFQSWMDDLLGGQPDEVPGMHDLASPSQHVSAACPPTLLFHGADDSLTPAQATRALHRALIASGVAAVYVEFPQTEHAFDLLLPRYSPPTQAALYDLDRFLALMAAAETGPSSQPVSRAPEKPGSLFTATSSPAATTYQVQP